ncbi:hypothetical protein ACVR0P_00535 [Streptococcus castoreus]|uniref:hypothetical protein n=1 Tax=Streptococcus castoreus TaxID=254786 RepID=UPI000425554F|nr:hypothetical protein [Streptococcus castoreus]
MKLKRQTHLVKIGAPVTILIGNDRKITLWNGQSIAFDLPEGETMLTIKHSRQVAKRVTAQDQLILKDNPLNLVLFWGGVLLILGSHVFLSFDNNLLFYLTLTGFISLASSYLVPRFQWKMT